MAWNLFRQGLVTTSSSASRKSGVALEPGESRTVAIVADPRLLAQFDGTNGLGHLPARAIPADDEVLLRIEFQFKSGVGARAVVVARSSR